MKNILLLVLLFVLLVFSFRVEPIEDTIDIIGGATSTTYDAKIDATAGASEDDDEDDDDDEPEDEEDEEDDD